MSNARLIPETWVLTSPGHTRMSSAYRGELSVVPPLKSDLTPAPVYTQENLRKDKRELRAEIRDELNRELEKKRVTARRKLAAALKKGRARLRGIEAEIRAFDQKVAQLSKLIAQMAPYLEGYPEPPAPCIDASDDGNGLPLSGGVYFVWRQGAVVYVGQAKNFCNRLRARNHHVLKIGDRLSFLEFPMSELNFAECYYIARTRPVCNFGGRGKIE